MKHLGSIQLETERLIFRRATLEDVPTLFSEIYSDKDVTKYIHSPCHKDISETEAIYREFISQYESLDFYRWLVFKKEDNSLVATCGASSVLKDEEEAILSCYLVKKEWSKGYGYEIVNKLCDFLLEEAEMKVLTSYVYEDNIGSRRIMEKLGFSSEIIGLDETKRLVRKYRIYN